MILERLNEMGHIAFPFREDVSRVSLDGTALPDNFLLDLSLSLYSRGSGDLVLYSIAVTTDTAIVTFKYFSPGDEPVVMSEIVPATAAESYACSLHEDSAFDLFTVFGPGVAELCAKSELNGVTLMFEDSLVEPGCIFIRNDHIVSGMTGVQVSLTEEGEIVTEEGDRLTGDVKIWPGYNMSVTFVPAANGIRLSAMPNEGEGMSCDASVSTRNCEDMVYRINGKSPDWSGDFILEGGPGIQVIPDPDNNKIIIKTEVKACNPGCNDEKTTEVVL